MAIRGIIGAFSKNKSPHLISDEALMDWYDNIHIPDVIATSGVKTALRFDSLSEGAEWPWLVVYPVQDILFSETDEFDQIPKGGHEEILHRQFPDLAALDLRISERVSVFQAPTAKKGRSRYVLAESISAPSTLDEDFNRWFDGHYAPKLASIPDLRRATRYKLYHSLTEGSPRHLVFYEFDSSDIPLEKVAEIRARAGLQGDLKSELKFDATAYQLAKEAGILDEAL